MTTDVQLDYASAPAPAATPDDSSEPQPRHPVRVRRHFRIGSRWGALVLFLILGAGVMWPFRTEELSPVSTRDIVIPVMEARRAIDEGQFPVRVSPRTLDGTRYPMFQFYGNLPITASAAVYRVFNITPFQAWKLVMLLATAVGGFYAYRCAYQLTRHPPASLVAGVLFVTAPYFLFDLNVRAAYSEYFGLCLLPAAFYFTLRAFVSRRRRVRNVICCATAWTAIGLSHNIVYLYGVTFIGFYFVMQAVGMLVGRGRALRKYLRRMTRLVVAGVLHAGMIVWYVIPQLLVLDQLMMTERTEIPFTTAARLNPLHVLLAGWPVSAPDSVLPLGLQIGWPILGGVALAVLGTILTRRGRRSWPLLVALLVPFLVAVFMVWSPVNFWNALPGPYKFVQMTYRLLMFVVLFGAILGGVGLALWLPRRAGWRRGYAFWSVRSTLVALVACAFAGYMARNYIPEDTVADPNSIQADMDNVDRLVGLEDYQISNDVAAKSSWYHRDLNLAGWQYNIFYGEYQVRDVLLPGPKSAAALVVEGVVRTSGDGVPPVQWLQGAKLIVSVQGRTEAFAFTPNPADPPAQSFRVRVPLDPNRTVDSPWPVRIVAESPYGIIDRALKLTNVKWESPAAGELDDRELRPAEAIASQVRQGRRTSYRFVSGRPTLVQLPVLYYPKGLLDVRDFGKTVREENVGNIGRFLAVKLPPGTHDLQVKFRGTKWANDVSLAAWGVVGIACVVGVIRWRRGRRAAIASSTACRRAAPPMGFVLGVVAAGAVILGASGQYLYEQAVDQIKHRGPRLAVIPVASSVGRPDHEAGNAVDGKPGTVWSALGSGPASIALYPQRAARLEHITLESRGTALLECWHKARVVLRLSGQQVYESTFDLPTADRVVEQHIEIPPTLTDQVEIYFSEPVLKTITGQVVPAGAVNPGYREIKLRWAPDKR